MNEITTTTTEIVQTAIKWLENMGYLAKMTKPQKEQFVEICGAYGLNPFKREIYAIPYADKFNIIVGYEVYLKRAERSGKLDGWEVSTSGSIADGTLASTVTIYRKDWRMPFKHSAYLSEFNGKSPLWQKSPTFMLEKVAISQGFRMAFPDELGGIPYTEEETTTFSKAELINVTPQTIEANPAPAHKEIADMTLDEIDEAIDKGLKSVYNYGPAREMAVAKYPDKVELLKHLRKKYAEQQAKKDKKAKSAEPEMEQAEATA